MGIINRLLVGLLTSPAHRLMSSKLAAVRYRGRRSGRRVTTLVQYARHEGDVVILAARPATKRWWRNFRDGHDLELLVEGRWVACRGRVVDADHDPEATSTLLDAYIQRFPAARRVVGGGGDPDARPVFVVCHPTNVANLIRPADR